MSDVLAISLNVYTACVFICIFLRYAGQQ